jgi:hypothetical protein
VCSGSQFLSNGLLSAMNQVGPALTLSVFLTQDILICLKCFISKDVNFIFIIWFFHFFAIISKSMELQVLKAWLNLSHYTIEHAEKDSEGKV